MNKTGKNLMAIVMTLIMVITALPVTSLFTAEQVMAADSQSVTVTAEIPGETTYVRHTSAITSGNQYLIVSGTGNNSHLLTNNSGIVSDTGVNVNNNTITGAISNEANVLWTFTENSGAYRIKNQDRFISITRTGGQNVLSLTSDATDNNNITVSQNGNAFNAYRNLNYSDRYLRYSNGWSVGTTGNTLYLYEKNVTGSREATLTLSPFVTDIVAGGTGAAITGSVALDGSTITNYTITWSSSDTDVVTVDENGNVTGYERGSAMVTATLTSVNGTALAEPISASVKVNVDRDISDGASPGTNNRQYPEEGAVKLNKTATSDLMDDYGLSKVELDVAGVGLRPGVDVVLIVDVSNSMQWSLERSGNTADADKRARDGEKTKLENAMTAAESFSEILLSGNSTSPGGSKYDNTVSFVTFAGYDKERSNNAGDQNTYVDSVMTVFTAETSFTKAQTSFRNTTLSYTSDYMLKVTDNNGNVLVNGRNRGNTNYDYAFTQAGAAVTALQSAYAAKWDVNYNSTGRDTYIVFMTDGAPSHYNGQTAAGDQGRDKLPTGTGNYNGGGYGTQQAWTNYFSSNRNTYCESLYDQVKGHFYAIGFDLAHGGFNTYQWTEETLVNLLQNLVTDAQIPVNATADAEELDAFYRSLANLIKPAGTEAQVIDTVNTQEFTVETKSYVIGDVDGTSTRIDFPAGVPNMEVKAYDLYTAQTAPSPDLIGTRTGTTTTLETVTFNEEGNEAYSDQINGGATNIMTVSGNKVVINARYFTYTKDPDVDDGHGNAKETFDWSIGDIPDKEISLSFYVYLKGSMEGQHGSGAEQTNVEATITYLDITDSYIQGVFPVPQTVWKDAVTDIEYYLVDKDGNPVNRTGQIIPFSLRIQIGDLQHLEFPINKTVLHSENTIINAEDFLPEGYVLYDPNAFYTVRASSGTVLEPLLEISAPSEAASVPPQNGAQTTIDVQKYEHDNSGKEYDDRHITSHIAFGVRYDLVPKMQLTRDVAVIDYAKPINIDILANDLTKIPQGFTADLAGYMPYVASTDMTLMYSVSGSGAITPVAAAEPDGGSGKFTLATVGKRTNSHYAMTSFMNTVDKVFGAVKFENTSDTADKFYMYNEIDVMPANNIYYEDDFMAEDNLNAAVGFVYTGTWSQEETTNPGQNTETANNLVHGGWISEDPGLSTDKDYSDGSAHKTTTSGAKVTFNFTGTGVDVYTRTNTQAGQVRARLYDSTNKMIATKIIDNYSKSGDYYQIPTLSFGPLDFGTYKLELTAGKKTDASGTRSTYYIDGIRVYNPIQNLESDAVVSAAYGAAELGATFTIARELFAEGSAAFVDQVYKLYYQPSGDEKTYVSDGTDDIILATGGTFDEEKGTFVNAVGEPIVDTAGRTISVAQKESGAVECTVDATSISLIVPSNCEVGTEAGGSAVGDYNNSELGKVAPLNEIYLAKDQSVVIQTTGSANAYYLGIKRLEADATVSVTYDEGARELNINHTTDLFYRVVPNDENQIIVSNSGDGKIAITKLRMTGAVTPATEGSSAGMGPLNVSNVPAALMAFRALPIMVSDEAPLTEEEIEEQDAEQTQEEETVLLDEDDITIENPEGYDLGKSTTQSDASAISQAKKSARLQGVINQLLKSLFGGLASLFG